MRRHGVIQERNRRSDMARSARHETIILTNAAALSLSPDFLGPGAGVRLVLAGPSRLQLIMAAAAAPEAEVVLTDFGQSASLAALAARLRDMGGLDRLVLAGDGSDSAEIFSMMQTIVSVLPVLRRGQDGRIVLSVTAGPAVAALSEFLKRLVPTLARHGIALDVRVRDDVAAA
jgi:hypothetical protein